MTETVEGPDNVKSGGGVTVKVTATALVIEPLVPLTVTVYVPGVEELHDRVDAAVVVDGVRVTLAGFNGKQFRPEGTASVSPTLFVKPPWPVRDIVEDPCEPATMLGFWPGAMAKFCRVFVSVIVRE